jgi:hypothetical protein
MSGTRSAVQSFSQKEASVTRSKTLRDGYFGRLATTGFVKKREFVELVVRQFE